MSERIQLPLIEPFKDELLQDQKAIALKPPEESAEVFGVWQDTADTSDPWQLGSIFYEIADVMQACVNFASMLGGPGAEALLSNAYDMVHKSNGVRGRYADE